MSDEPNGTGPGASDAAGGAAAQSNPSQPERGVNGFGFDPRWAQRNLANRLFPGPTKEMSQQAAEHIRTLLATPEGQASVRALRERRDAAKHGAARTPGAGGRRGDAASTTGLPGAQSDPALDRQNALPPVSDPAAPANAGTDAAATDDAATTDAAPAQPDAGVTTTPSGDDIALLHAAVDQQNELLRAILQSNVDTQADARSTAQNSRTFAWAGTAIALLTLVATVLALIAAFR